MNMQWRTWFAVASLVSTMLLSTLAVADSATVSYQGILRDAALAPVADSTYEMTFSLWDAPSGGDKLWGDETHPAVSVAGGVFSVHLGSIESFDTEFSDFSELWLEITADTGAGPETYAPRVPLASVPYAQHAKHADTADSASTADSALTADTALQADNALTADTALQADNASALGGQPPSAYASANHTHALGELSNVSSANPSDGHALAWNQSAGQWEGTGGYAILRDIRGGNAGGNSVGWNIRSFNNFDTNIPNASHSGTNFSLPAGRYWITARAPAYRSERHQIVLYNLSAGSNAIPGTAERSPDNDATTTYSVLEGPIELSSSTTFQIRHHMTAEKSSNGLGLQANTPGVGNVYTVVTIRKF